MEYCIHIYVHTCMYVCMYVCICINKCTCTTCTVIVEGGDYLR